MKKAFVLINNSGVGGAERRFARCFSYLLRQEKGIYLIINLRLYNLLRKADLLSSKENIFILKDVFSGLFGQIEKRFPSRILSNLLFFIKKIDYIIFALQTRVIFKKNKISLAHLILGGAYVGLPLILNKQVQIIVSVVGLLKGMIGSIIGYYLYLIVLRKAVLIDALNSNIRNNLVFCGLPAGKIAVPPGSFTDIERYYPAQNKKDWVVFAGRFLEKKNPLLFVEAIPLILSSFPSAKFYLLGEGPLENNIRMRIQKLGISDSIKVKFLPDIGEVLIFSRIFVSIQKEENYPSQSLLEAMACGNTIVATDCGETRRLVDEKVGLLIKEDVKELADAVIKLLSNPAMLKEMGICARERIMSEHNIEAFVGYLNDLYKKAMEERIKGRRLMGGGR